MVLCNL
ncbi:hypothetical protein O3G_MSEX001105, partial [Manduca sexta]